MPTLSEDLTFRGLIHQITDPDLPKRLDQPGLTVYAGFDPTADSLHVGNLLQLCTLRRFQEAGHRPISLAGGGTGMIGDPGRKAGRAAAARPPDDRGLPARASAPSSGSSSTSATEPSCSTTSTGLSTLSTLEYLRDVGKHFTVNQMVAKESVKTRFERPDQGISYTEFSYMLLQAYDFLRLHVDHGCELQIGGSDQWGNITMGVELVRKVCGDEVWGLTTPLIVKADGTKYGKTESGTVWLDPAADQPLRHVPVLPQHARRAGRPAAAVPHLPEPRRDHELDAETAEQPAAPRRPSGRWPAPSSRSCTARPRWPSARRRRRRSSARRSPG